MRTVKIFSSYKQENQFTNGLVSLLELSKKDRPQFVKSFLKELVTPDLAGTVQAFHVLKEIDGAADAELCGKDFCIRIETKIRSGILTHKQVRLRLDELQRCKKRLKRLVLLTPDDSNSAYIKDVVSLDATRIIHLEWRRVYEFLERQSGKIGAVFSKLVDQYLELIHDTVFDQDIVGIILFIQFGKKSGIDQEAYLDEIEQEPWDSWSTPKKYKGLDGTGRKLLLYDKVLKAITVEGEVKRGERTRYFKDYPYTHFFAPGTLRKLPVPIKRARIRQLKRFEYFGKCQNAAWNLTHEEYRELMGRSR